MGVPSSRYPDLVRDSMVVAHWMSKNFAELLWARAGPLSLVKPETSLWDTIQTGWRKATFGWPYRHLDDSNTIRQEVDEEKEPEEKSFFFFFPYSISLPPPVDKS